MHIYAISRLYKKTPSAWLSVMKNLDQSKLYASHQYRPLRQAIVGELVEPGSGSEMLQSFLETRETAGTQESVDAYSHAAFRKFQEHIQPQIRSLEQSFLEPQYDPPPVTWEDFEIQGRFHCSIRDFHDRIRYCYLHPSRWNADETESFVELLVILAELRYQASREDVWFVDLRQGSIVAPSTHFKKLRSDLLRTIEVFSRLENTVEADYGTI